MNEVIRVDASRHEVVNSCAELLPLPMPHELPGGGVNIREALPGDLPFIDALQKTHNKAVGWMPTAQLEGHIAKGHVLIAEAINVGSGIGDGVCQKSEAGESRSDIPGTPCDIQHASTSDIPHTRCDIPHSSGGPVGYCIGVDKYFKREDTGIIYQMNITPGRQRGLVGATLLKAMFDRWPYGVRLCCCWCAQDLQANHFWEAMGFVPLAFRAGSRKRDRVHIFWQKMIRKQDQEALAAGDTLHTSPSTLHISGGGGWWYPSQTGSGAIREDRIVLPIPPGTHWSDAKPKILPGVAALIEEAAAAPGSGKALQGPADKEARARQREAKKAKAAQTTRPAQANAGGLWFGAEPRDGIPGANPGPASEPQEPKKKRTSGGAKNDPRLVAAARELRDRWMEKVAAEPGLIEAGCSGGKYEVARQISSDEAAIPGVNALPEVPGAGALPGAGLLDAA